MKIQIIDDKSLFLKDVMALGRKNNSTLGFFPEGAFRQHAFKRWILGAVLDNELIGYLLFRIVAKTQVVIVHLCVKQEHRKSGVARELVNTLREMAKGQYFAIKLFCRRDYKGASEFWRKLGFVYSNEKQGKSGNPLLAWRMDLSQPPLLAFLRENSFQDKLRVVIDMNIFIRLQDPVPEDDELQQQKSEEAKALEAGWLSDEIMLCITDELSNEIEKNENPQLRSQRLSFTRWFERIGGGLEEVQELEQKLMPLFSDHRDDNLISDIRQIAYSIAGGANFFVTLDNGILNRSQILYENFGIKVLRPSGLIAHLDEVLRDADYQPKRLASSRITSAKLHSGQIKSLYHYFLCSTCLEKGTQFEQKIQYYLAQPKKYNGQVIRDHTDKPLAIIVYDESDPSQLKIPILRVAKSQLSGTLLRYLIFGAVSLSASKNLLLTRVTEKCNHAELHKALEEAGFSFVSDAWVKVNLSLAEVSSRVIETINQLGNDNSELREFCQEINKAITEGMSKNDINAMIEIEHLLWPAKILDIPIPTFIIPIMPLWAQHLFDSDMANQTLFGAREDLVLRNENIYYRSSKAGRNLSAPGRILWYVSNEKPYQGTKAIRACSLLNEVVIGKAKDLYQRFERLGIYEWRNIIELTGNDPDGEIMVLRFSNTEVFSNPVDLETQKTIIQQYENKGLMRQGPQQISARTFELLYRCGIRFYEEA